LESLPHNIAEIGLLEHLDIHDNKLQELPDLSNLKLLEELIVHTNKLKDLDHFRLKRLIHLRELDISNNEIQELPICLERLVNVHDFRAKNNKIKKIPIQICDMFALKNLDLEDNPITDPPRAVWSQGINEIRKHFNWDKPFPKDPTQKKTKRVARSLSTRDKRALLVQNRQRSSRLVFHLNQLKNNLQANDIAQILRQEIEKSPKFDENIIMEEKENQTVEENPLMEENKKITENQTISNHRFSESKKIMDNQKIFESLKKIKKKILR